MTSWFDRLEGVKRPLAGRLVPDAPMIELIDGGEG